MSDDTYNEMFTMHGVMMVFFFLIPVIPGVLGGFFLIPDHDRRQGLLGLPEAEPRQLVPCIQIFFFFFYVTVHVQFRVLFSSLALTSNLQIK